jgi:glycosyltransferase involved in cell wall biosynthesis
MFDSEYDVNDKEKQRQKKIIQAFDRYALDPSRIKKHYAIGQTVVDRLKKSDSFWDQINFEVIYPATRLSAFNNPEEGRFIFLPGRLHRWKRVDLIINAMKFVKSPVQLVIAGKGEEEENLKRLVKKSGLEERVQFLGTKSDNEVLDLYSNSLVIPFVPVNEDYGYVTIEAFKSKKPVITCQDSGEPARIVKNNITGFIVEPNPQKIAEKINYFIDHPEKISVMGNAGFESVKDITWDKIIPKLLENITLPGTNENSTKINILITDMQPIEPAVGGGRIRLKGLYSNLGDAVTPFYIGTYDWRGPGKREITISPTLREKDIPLSEEHFKMNEYCNNLLPGKTIIDSIFPFLAEASQEFVTYVRNEATRSDVIIFSHPWMYPVLKTEVNFKNKMLVYDSQNCEALLRQQILGDASFSRCIVNMVKFTEKELCESADLILACSEEDKDNFIRLYGISPDKIEIFPNGVDVEEIKPATVEEKNKCKKRLKISTKTAIFIGSDYPPNIEAAHYIIDTLADRCPDVTFFIVGGVGNRLNTQNKSNVVISGFVTDDEKKLYLTAADIAINPMIHGSGTNIKMFDFLAAGLPAISTPVGARGINNSDSFIVADLCDFSKRIQNLILDEDLRERLGKRSRLLVEESYNWKKISENLGLKITRIYYQKIRKTKNYSY